jgi:pyrroline-5-carboxylate reductase
MANRIGVIGAGVMGEALIAALIRSGISPSNISFAEKRADRAEELEQRYAIIHKDIEEVASASDVILLVIKPQDMATTLDQITSSINPEALIISFSAGKTISTIASKLSTAHAIVRVMPNTPALIGLGASGYSFGDNVTREHKNFVNEFLAATGKAIEVPEPLQDAVTATSGSGPAYFFAFVESMIDGSVELGLSRAEATTLTIQTIVGAAAMLEGSGDSPRVLREKVTSPHGTTFAALSTFSSHDLNGIVKSAMKAAADRSRELSQ